MAEDFAEKLAAVHKHVQDRRFALPKNKEIKARINKFEDGLNKLKSGHSEVLGATIYGSMVTGAADVESDVDGFVYLEADAVKDILSAEDWQYAREEKRREKEETINGDVGRGMSELDYAAIHKYRPLVDEALINEGLTTEQIKHIRIRTINDEIIQQDLNQSLTEARQLIQYKSDIQKWNEKINTLPMVEWPPEEERPHYPKSTIEGWGISALFHLQIGHNLDRYRATVINYLAQNEEAGEQVWKNIIGRTSDLERHLHGSNYAEQYPMSLNEAKEYYKTIR